MWVYTNIFDLCWCLRMSFPFVPKNNSYNCTTSNEVYLDLQTWMKFFKRQVILRDVISFLIFFIIYVSKYLWFSAQLNISLLPNFYASKSGVNICLKKPTRIRSMLTVAREVAERYNLTEVESDRHRLHHSVLWNETQ